MTGNIRLATARVADLAAVMRVMDAAFESAYGEAWSGAQLLTLFALPSARVCLAWEGEIPCGFSAARIAGLLDAERAAGIASERLILAGFSQGCAMTLYTGLRYPHRLGGLLALSGYLPLHESLAAEASAANKDVPIFMCHGQYDPVLPLVLGKSSAEILGAAGYRVDWHEYPMQHQVCPEEIDDIGDFLRARLA